MSECLEKRPERRYRSAAALADDLDRCLRKEPVWLGEEGRLRRLGWAVERHWRKLVAAVALLLALVGGFLLLPQLAPTGQERPDRDKALRKIAAQLAMGKAVTLIGEKGPPQWSRWLINRGGSIEQAAEDGSFAFSRVQDSLLAILDNPGRAAYRFSAEIRHDGNPNDGEIGLF